MEKIVKGKYSQQVMGFSSSIGARLHRYIQSKFYNEYIN